MANIQLPKTYDFAATEERIYRKWESSGWFKPTNDPNLPGHDPAIKPFVISIPPPNVTGELHLGHALFVAMEDLMIRYHRMQGTPTLWVPGSDHAGIATQLQVERLLRSEGLTRDQLGREEFVRRVWEWKNKYGGIITRQIRRLGASCDWDRERFTMDEGLSRAVREAFVQLYEKGLIYRGPRLINWSPGLRTAVSDLEVEYSQETGTLYTFKYMLADGSGDFIPVATTRPETILGDTAVAVHPEDERYQRFVGKQAIVPILGRLIPVIADDYVDREFGTGGLKVTPAHDPNDYLIGQRHNLEMISMLDEGARVNENGGPYAGLDRYDARKQIWADMAAQGLTIKTEPYEMSLPRSQRGGEQIEPMISTQWFVSIQTLADAARKAVENGSIRIVPERFTRVYFNWLAHIQDWCISRQLWWGHRIPVWYCADCGEMTVAREDPSECAFCHSKNIEQDPDVLDTWFSSGLWPFSTLGWPEETPDYRYFYPTSVLETGYDILFFWVMRMIMDGLEFTGQPPFHTVYLHGLIRDEFGQKMSKSKNNVVDPLPVMEDLGTDALRFTLLVGSTPGADVNLSLKKVEANRNFANKIWNAGRFVIGALQQCPVAPLKAPQWTLADSWIWARLQALVREVDHLFGAYQFGEAGRQIYEFFWGEFADWYLESAKAQLASPDPDRVYYTGYTLVRVLDTCLRLLHPYTPFVTEELWGYLKAACQDHPGFAPADGWEEALIIARFPEPRVEEDWEAGRKADFALVQEVVRSIRNLRTEKKVPPSRRIAAILVGGDQMERVKEGLDLIIHHAGLDAGTTQLLEKITEKPSSAVSTVVGGVEIYLPLAGLVDMDEERSRLIKERDEIQAQITRLTALLEGSFAQKAPANVVERERQKLEEYRISADRLQAQIDHI